MSSVFLSAKPVEGHLSFDPYDHDVSHSNSHSHSSYSHKSPKSSKARKSKSKGCKGSKGPKGHKCNESVRTQLSDLMHWPDDNDRADEPTKEYEPIDGNPHIVGGPSAVASNDSNHVGTIMGSLAGVGLMAVAALVAYKKVKKGRTDSAATAEPVPKDLEQDVGMDFDSTDSLQAESIESDLTDHSVGPDSADTLVEI